MSSLQTSTAVEPHDRGAWASIDPAWDVWGPCGGYVASIALRAAGFAVPAGHRPVTLTCQYLKRGDHGPADLAIEVVKPGSSACVNVALLQGGERILQAQVWTTSKTVGPMGRAASMPDVPPPESLESMEVLLPRHGHAALAFWQNIDGRPIDFRMTGDPDPRGGRIERWLNYRGWETTDDPFLDAARSVVAIDTHVWTAHLRRLAQPVDYVAPSLDLTVWFHQSAGPADWLLVEARSDEAGDGLIHGDARVWTRDGRLVASGGSQCLVVPFRRPS